MPNSSIQVWEVANWKPASLRSNAPSIHRVNAPVVAENSTARGRMTSRRVAGTRAISSAPARGTRIAAVSSGKARLAASIRA